MSTPSAEPALNPDGLTPGMLALRVWANTQSPAGHPVRDELMRGALSASIRRLVTFGVEPGLQRYEARHLLQFQSMCSGEFAGYLARIACTRAIVEDSRDLLALLSESGLVADQLAWFDRFETAGATRVLELLKETDPEEERHVARLVVARRHPQLAEAAWLWEIPETLALVGGALALVLIRARSDLLHLVADWLVSHPDALASADPDDLLTPLVLASDSPPQQILARFEGWYGERTVLAAAEWHLEHGQPGEALQLAARTRGLSPLVDRARLIAALASIELGELVQATELHHALAGTSDADLVAIRLAERDPTAITTAELVAIIDRSVPNRPATFLAGLKLLLGRHDLAAVRAVALRHARAMEPHPALAQLIGTIIAGG